MTSAPLPDTAPAAGPASDNSAPASSGTVCRLALDGEAATLALARRLAPLLRPGDVIALRGDLGAGKSTFARAVIRALGVEGAIPSPTFTLIQSYDLAPGGALEAVHHADLYRLADPEEVIELGLDDLLAGGALLVEWPDRGVGFLPQAALTVSLETGSKDTARVAVLEGDEQWYDGRWSGLTQ
ncbi:MAG: tRNA (adenosine(37)-N6)-threonylcarbamoyltransferase complex ATPase subunit type 1 TsaE [Alphaproteobacteria bacterium]|nr:tRNA (adenosine(37)-N6)-threonylcarbamoyltransferase complex ATPase subunit type 1 TsaE [Alphaproteobacteria bacterium]